MQISQIVKYGMHKALTISEGNVAHALWVMEQLGGYTALAAVVGTAPEFEGKTRKLADLLNRHTHRMNEIFFDALHQVIEAPAESTFESVTKRLQYAQLVYLDKLAAIAA